MDGSDHIAQFNYWVFAAVKQQNPHFLSKDVKNMMWKLWLPIRSCFKWVWIPCCYAQIFFPGPDATHAAVCILPYNAMKLAEITALQIGRLG